MRRRGFFSILAGVVLSPIVAKLGLSGRFGSNPTSAARNVAQSGLINRSAHRGRRPTYALVDDIDAVWTGRNPTTRQFRGFEVEMSAFFRKTPAIKPAPGDTCAEGFQVIPNPIPTGAA